MSKLNPKVKAFGFNQKELKGVAAKIADNLTLEEDASDEDINAAIDEAIDAVIPYLEAGRSYANRVINDSQKNGDEDNSDKDNDEDSDSKSNKSSNKSKKVKSANDDVPAWAQAIIDSNNALKSQIEILKGEKIADSRKAKLEKLLKNTGTFGTRTLKSFGRMKFENDDEFDEFYSEIEEDLKSFNQERANAGLEKLGAPAIGNAGKKEEKPEVLSEDEVKAIAKM